MKKIFRLTTATLAVFALASCSNDDFFGNPTGGFGDQLSIEATVDAPVIESSTRAYATSAAAFDWATGDELRVYDNQLQKYDNFTYNTSGSGKAFVLSNTKVDGEMPQYVENYVDASDPTKNGYALFGGRNAADNDENAISYAGWKQKGTSGVPVALVKMPATLKYKEANLSTDNTKSVYKIAIPLWGRVKEPATSNAQFSTDLHWLTGIVKVTFENANKLGATAKIGEVRARALTPNDAFRALPAADQAGILANIKKGAQLDKDGALAGTIGSITVDGAAVATYNTTTWATYFALTTDKPLYGWFDAELADDGVLVKTTDKAIAQPADTRNPLAINVAGQMVKNSSVVFIPVICDTYDVLVVEYNTLGDDDTYTVAGAVKNKTFSKGGMVSTTVSFANTSKVVDAANTIAATDGIASAYDGTADAEVILNSDDDRNLVVQTGSELLNTIYLPQITDKNLSVTILGTTGTELNENLVIADANGITSQGTGKVTINIEGFKNPSAAKSVTINSKANITLTGDFSAANVGLTTGDDVTSLALGISGTSPVAFDYGTKGLNITKGNLTVNNLTAAGLTYNNASGTIATACDLANLTIAKASSATVGGAVSTKLATSTNLTIDAVGKEIVALQVDKGVSAITLNNGIIGNIAETATTADQYAASTGTVLTVTSSGLSAIRKVTDTGVSSFAKNGGKVAFTSSFAVPTAGAKFVDAFDATSNDGFIYTGAQLAAVAQGGTEAGTAGDQTAFALKTNITGLTNWQSPNLGKPFVGGKAAENGLTIAGVDAPLFGEVGANVSDVDLTVAINKSETGIGGLAKTTKAATAIAVKNVAVAGTISAQNKVGGVFGTTSSGNVTFGDGLASSTNGVSVNVAFTNNTSYPSTVALINTAGTFGKFIGQAGTGAVVINKECSVGSAAFSKSALHFNYNRLLNSATGVIEWQFLGNSDLIGYSPAATSLTYGEKVYTSTWADPNTGTATAVAYDGDTKKVTGTVRIINASNAVGDGSDDYPYAWYTSKDAAFKAKMKATFATALGAVAADADWSGLTVEVHNLWEAYTK